MKRFLLSTLFVAFSFVTFAQPDHREPPPNDQRLRVEKNNFIKERLNLSEEQEKEFFVLFDEYNRKRHDFRIEMTQNRLGLRKSNLTDKEAKIIIDKELVIKSNMVKLEREYVEKYYKILTPVQIIELYKADDDFNKIIMKRLRERRR